jgi:translation initiation factor 1
MKKLLKALKRNFHCNGSLQKDADLGEILQISGDHRVNIRGFLIEQKICNENQIIMHGG